MRVDVTRRAAAQLERAARWWAKNRLAAPDAIAEEFDQAKVLLGRQPKVGAKCMSPRYPDLRRLFLSRVGYHLYYRPTPKSVIVLAFWHASRGTAPPL